MDVRENTMLKATVGNIIYKCIGTVRSYQIKSNTLDVNSKDVMKNTKPRAIVIHITIKYGDLARS